MRAMTRRAASALAALTLLVAISGAVGYTIGYGAGAGPRVTDIRTFRNVPVWVGDAEVSAQVDGVTYGLSGALPQWIDADGSTHSGGWPTCLPWRTQARISFGGAFVYGPTVGDARILWVDCRQ